MKKFKIPCANEDTSVTKTIRIKKTLVDKLESLADKNNITVNKLITECILYALDNMEDDNN